RVDLCASERFLDQPSAIGASGFLVAPNILATAGHLFPFGKASLSAYHAVFGYRLKDGSVPPRFERKDVYELIDLIDLRHTTSGADWALVQLDRKVTQREPLKLRKTGRIEDGASVYVIGYPFGLPQKFADNARVTRNDRPDVFNAPLDA